MNWETIKEKMGFTYGSLKEESKLDELSDMVTPKSKYDRVVSTAVTGLLMQLFIPWIEYCFSKYTEPYFHIKMTAGFDFIQDWKDNHPERYHYILKAIRAVRNKIILDNEKMLLVILNECSKRGWTITEWEKGRFRENIATFKAEVYS